MKQTKKALICALVGAAISTPAFAQDICPIKRDVEGRYKVITGQQIINGEKCATYRGEADLEIDIDCPSERHILTVWLDLKTKEQFLRTNGYVSRLRCIGEWKANDTMESEAALYDARLVAIHGKSGHGDDDIEHYSEDCVLDGHPDAGKPGVYVCE